MSADVCALYLAKAVSNYHGCEVEIVGNPNNYDDPRWASHMVNDRLCMSRRDQAQVYTQASLCSSNAQIGPRPFPEGLINEDLIRCVATWTDLPWRA